MPAFFIFKHGVFKMLLTTEFSTAKKTRGLAVTYRAGKGNKFSTCPNTCPLKPLKNCGTDTPDLEYLKAVSDAVPRRGKSFTYSHFPYKVYKHLLRAGKTVINFSADKIADAIDAVKNNVPAVLVVPVNFWDGSNKIYKKIDGVNIVRCIDEINGGGCQNCGNGAPWCARLDRKFIVAFTAHGSGKKSASDIDADGGCYANGGNVQLHWDRLSKKEQLESDAEKIQRFASGLPPYTILRHHIAGDMGKS